MTFIKTLFRLNLELVSNPDLDLDLDPNIDLVLILDPQLDKILSLELSTIFVKSYANLSSKIISYCPDLLYLSD